MCNGGGPAKITITVSATTDKPYPPGLSDGVTTMPIGGGNDANFTTEVVANQPIQFVVGGDVTAITEIKEGPGSDIFSTDPTPANKFLGKIGSLPKGDTREYAIYYTVAGNVDENGNPVVFQQDPKLQMKR